MGSSPRVWGQETSVKVCPSNTGIIPTRMGTSYKTSVRRQDKKDHPHAYGDKRICTRFIDRFGGSSPRVWGQEDMQAIMATPKRIIPTRMGTRESPTSRRGRHEDHPHAYGDKTAMSMELYQPQGSSPRVWGQVLEMQKRGYTVGIIPTRMGTSINFVRYFWLFKDHPHAYGDKPVCKQTRHTRRGSSPRVWGQGIQHSNYAVIVRIIPTRMGTRRVCANRKNGT